MEEKREQEKKEQENSTTVDALLKEIKELKTKTVPVEELEQLKSENAKLVAEVVNNRPVVKDEHKKTETRQDVIDRCKKRTASIGQGSSLTQIKSLCENYGDMQKLDMDVSSVDENVVEGLESIIREANGDEQMFTALMGTRIKETK